MKPSRLERFADAYPTAFGIATLACGTAFWIAVFWSGAALHELLK